MFEMWFEWSDFVVKTYSAFGLLPFKIDLKRRKFQQSFPVYSLIIFLFYVTIYIYNLIEKIEDIKNSLSTRKLISLIEILLNIQLALAVTLMVILFRQNIQEIIQNILKISKITLKYRNHLKPNSGRKLLIDLLVNIVIGTFPSLLIIILKMLEAPEQTIYLGIKFVTNVYRILITTALYGFILVVCQFYRLLNSRIEYLVKKIGPQGHGLMFKFQFDCNLGSEIDIISSVYDQVTKCAIALNKILNFYIIFYLMKLFYGIITNVITCIN